MHQATSVLLYSDYSFIITKNTRGDMLRIMSAQAFQGQNQHFTAILSTVHKLGTSLLRYDVDAK